MLTIRRVKIEEISDVKKLLKETWIDTYKGFISLKLIESMTSNWHSLERLTEEAKNPEKFFAVAKEGESIVGTITAYPLDSETLYIGRMYVFPRHQRKGIGEKLFNAALSQFPNVTKARLEVEELNLKGMSFYRKHGFVEISRDVTMGEGERTTIITMERKLK